MLESRTSKIPRKSINKSIVNSELGGPDGVSCISRVMLVTVGFGEQLSLAIP